jgi:AmiR/NasT family two-component response regulator
MTVSEIPEIPASYLATASSIVSAQAECTVDEALEKMRQHAQMIGQSIEAVAETVVHGRTRFDG